MWVSFRVEIVKSLLLSLLSTSPVVVIGIFYAYLAHHANELSETDYIKVIVGFLLFIFLGLAFLLLNEIYANTFNLKILSHISPAIWKRVLNLPLNSFRKISSGEMSRAISDYESALSRMTLQIIKVVNSLVLAVVLFTALAWYFYDIFKPMFLSVIIIYLIKISLCVRNSSYIYKKLTENTQLFVILNESFLQISKIRAAGAESYVFKKWISKFAGSQQIKNSIFKVNTANYVLDNLVLPIWLIILFLYGFSQIGTSASLIILMSQLSMALSKSSNQLEEFIYLLPYLKRFNFLLAKGGNEDESTGSLALSNVRGEISLSHVSFKPSGHEGYILNDINLHIFPGQHVGITGPSGAGKSSLARLILGLEKPRGGKISIDGINLAHLEIKSLRKSMGLVLQSSELFPGTIFSNIAMNHPLTLDEAWALARYVNLDQEILKMPMKMFTYISDNIGESVSGGQRQKILIARALAIKPRILLFDEATSALDNDSQAIVYENLKNLNITRISIAHRISAFQDVDVLYTLRDGKIL